MQLLNLALPIVIRGGPNWAEWITAGATIFVAVGLLFASAAIKESRHSRHSSIAADMARRWNGQDLAEARRSIKQLTPEELYERYQSLSNSDDERFFVLERLVAFFEELAALEAFGWISIEWIDATLGTAVMEGWDAWRLVIDTEYSIDPYAFQYFPALSRKLHRRRDYEWRGLPAAILRNLHGLRRQLATVTWKCMRKPIT
jgi:hypothetical protein